MSQTPMMQQYQAAKKACPDALLLFRMGDFYELFGEDAKLAARVLGLTLTSRDKGEDPLQMAGFPHHQLENYLTKIVRAGMRAAICDQVEDPKKAKGLVKREVTRIVTAGTLTDDAILDPRDCNYLAAIAPGDEFGLAWVELSTGHFQAAVVPSAGIADELARIGPAECLVSVDAPPEQRATFHEMVLTERPGWAFAESTAREALAKHFGTTTLEGFGFEPSDTPAIRAAGAVLDYLAETQKTNLGHIDRLIRYGAGSTLELDQSTRRSLEISQTIRDGRREGSLLAILDECTTAMGSRLLSKWLAFPLTDPAEIDQRLGAVEEFADDDGLASELIGMLKGVYDVERLLARVTTGRASPRDLCFLGRTLGQLPHFKARLACRQSALLNHLEKSLDLCPELRATLDAALVDDCPLSTRDGGFLRRSYNERLDSLRELASGGKKWIADYQAAEIERSGISSLKIGFNKVFGYYLEVTHTHRDRVPENYIRKQTLKNAERFITPELKEYEEKVLSADERAKDLEYELFVELRETVAASSARLQGTAAALAQLDVLLALASIAKQRGYCRPQLVEEPVLRIIEGRHPVLDVLEPSGTFVPNDVEIGEKDGRLLLITGPNMAGKSTYIRQVALLTLMAQIGSFVPAKSATIGVADRIFARVGANDELSRGQSTFMVEMIETARILNTASRRSLVILDEIGRGTSTYDGVSLAWAVVEHLDEHIGCRALFATHYHELTDLERSLGGVKNLNVSVREWQDDVIFLHKIVAGAADKSYGIQVARLAGVPREVVQRAKEILFDLEQEHLDQFGAAKMSHRRSNRDAGELQLTLFGPAEHPLLEKLRATDVNDMTPMDALKLLHLWQQELAEETQHAKPR